MFNNLFTSKSTGCENCGEHSTLSKYGKIRIIKSRVIPDQDIDIERKSGLTFYTTTGEVIKANMTFKMGPWYFYWFEPLSQTNTDHDNVQIAELCSRKCAKTLILCSTKKSIETKRVVTTIQY